MALERSRLFVGEFVIDFHQRNDVTYYAISKNGSNDILSMGHEQTASEAEDAARWTISELIKATYGQAQSA